MTNPPRWTSEQLARNLELAIEAFRVERMEEPLEAYLEAFDEYQSVVENLLETSVELARLDESALDILTNPNLMMALRYLPGPPISEDDLKTLSESVLTPSRLRNEPEMVKRIVSVILTQLDRRRFLWVAESREPTESERAAAVLASAALLATQRLSTDRRSGSKTQQESKIEETLLRSGIQKVRTRKIKVLSQAPGCGEFCKECYLGNRKADFVVGLFDNRVMAIECKVSNSATNSIKRLNNDAAVKAGVWKRDFGQNQVVPAAVLSGVYNLHNLEDAQDRELTLFWAHDVEQLAKWILSTKSA